MQKRRPIKQHRQESTAREREPRWRIGDNTTETATELTQDGVRVIRRQLTADCTVSIVYPTSKKPTDVTVPAEDVSSEQCATQATRLESPEVEEQTKDSTNDEADTTSPILTEQLHPVPASPASPPPPQEHIINTPTATATRRTSASSSLTFQSAFLAPPEQPPVPPQHSITHQAPPQEPVQLPTFSSPSSSPQQEAMGVTGKTEPFVSKMHVWLNGLSQA